MPDKNLIPLVDLKAQYYSIKDEIDEAIARVLESGQFILGKEVGAFEEEFADYCGMEYAIGVGSGTDALYMALRSCGIKEGDEVITTPFTFIATIEAIIRFDAKPILVDIDDAYNINPSLIKSAITNKTKAILPVHLFGQPADMGLINAIGFYYGLAIIEDCAQAMGANVGCHSDAGCFSFFPSKNLGAYGDGGMVITNNLNIAARIRASRKHQILVKDVSRLDAIQAAILRVKLKHLDDWLTQRKRIAALYCNLLDMEYNDDHAYNYFTIRHPDRDGLQKYLAAKGIQTKVYYRELLADGDFPVAKKAAKEVLSLPIYPELTYDQVSYIAEAVKDYG